MKAEGQGLEPRSALTDATPLATAPLIQPDTFRETSRRPGLPIRHQALPAVSAPSYPSVLGFASQSWRAVLLIVSLHHTAKRYPGGAAPKGDRTPGSNEEVAGERVSRYRQRHPLDLWTRPLSLARPEATRGRTASPVMNSVVGSDGRGEEARRHAEPKVGIRPEESVKDAGTKQPGVRGKPCGVGPYGPAGHALAETAESVAP